MEFLLRVVDRSARDDDSKAGDVIEAQPDGFAWGPTVLATPFWRIVRADILPVTVDAIMSSSRGVVPKAVRRRDWKVDLTKLPALPQGVIVDLTRAQFMAAISKKP